MSSQKNILVKCKANDYLPIDLILEFQGKLKKLSNQNREKLVNSILKHGFIAPIFVWDNAGQNQILDGHQRLKTLLWMREQGYDIPLLPVDYIEAENEHDAREKLLYITSQYGEFDLEELNNWISEFDETIANDLRIVDKEIELNVSSINEETIGDDDILEDGPPITKKGDLWQLGNHFLLCGSSIDDKDIKNLMADNKADIVFTSPPYNIGRTPNGNEKKYLNDDDNLNQSEYVKFLDKFIELYLNYTDFIFENLQMVKGNKHALIEHVYNMREKYADTIIWNKENSEPAMARRVLNSQFEYIHIFSNSGNRAIGKKDFRGTIPNIFNLNSKSGKEFSKIHKATFRVELPEFFIKNFTESSVIDPFCGTGTTIIASEKLGRVCYGMEIDPHYCDVIMYRYKDWMLKNNKEPIVKLNGNIFNANFS